MMQLRRSASVQGNRGGGSGFVVQQVLTGGFQRSEFALHNIPDHRNAHTEVFMNEDITQPDNFSPFHLGSLFPDRHRHFPCRFTYDLKISDHSVLFLFVAQKKFLILLVGISLHFFDSGNDVFNIDLPVSVYTGFPVE